MESSSIAIERPANLKTWLVPCFDRIPTALRTGQQHVVWKPELRRDGKIGKVPYIARAALEQKAFRASSTKPRSWSTFAQATKAYQLGGYAGIGYVLSKGIIFIDIDHCIRTVVTEDSVIEEIHPVALEIIAMIDSYAELSPSGNGVHIFASGELPPDHPNIYSYQGLKIEVYTGGHYATLTGQSVAGIPFQEVQSRQAEVVAFLQRCSTGTKENTGVCGGGCGSSQAHQDLTPQARSRPGHGGAGALRNTNGQPPRALRQAIRPRLREEELPLEDQAILVRARNARNGRIFRELWQGGNPHHRKTNDGRPDRSAADFDLVLLLLYWCGDSATHDTSDQVEQLFRSSERYDDAKTDRITAQHQYSYLQMSIYNARRRRWGVPLPAAPAPGEDDPGPAPGTGPTPEGERQAEAQRQGGYQFIRYIYPWMSQAFDQVGRSAELSDLVHGMKDRALAHLLAASAPLYAVAGAPGMGKSYALAEICDELDTAVLVPRHELANGVPGYNKQRRIRTASKQNCPDHEKHHRLAAAGYNARPVHKAHDAPCDYILQFEESGSAIYQIAHSETAYMPQHQAIVIEEFNLPDWLKEKRYSVERLARAAHQFAVEAPASRFFVAWQAALTDLAQERGPGSYQGKEVLDCLNKHLWQNNREELPALLGTLGRDYHATDDHPWPSDIEADLPEVILPIIYHAVVGELATWQRGQDYNSCIRVHVSEKKRATLYVTTARRINTAAADGSRRAIALADATANKEVLQRWYGGEIILDRPHVDPPPHTRHYHVPEQCSKSSMQARHGRDQARAIRKLRFFLKQLDPSGEKNAAGLVGLITYMGNEDAIRCALGIPAGKSNHFWAARGSNGLEQCEILLIVGTPVLAPETIYRIARCLYRDDPIPIIEGNHKGESGFEYDDYRVQNLAEYLTNAELTQCAHRHRPLRYDGRITVSLCKGDIDYLPVTDFAAQKLPRLTEAGEEARLVKEAEDRATLDQTRRLLEVQAIPLGVHRLARAAGVATDSAARYLREWRAEQGTTHTHTPVVSPVPENPYGDNKCNVRYEDSASGADSAAPRRAGRPGTAASPPQCGEACIRCGQVDDWVRDLGGERWICACYYWWHEHPEWRSGGPPRACVG